MKSIQQQNNQRKGNTTAYLEEKLMRIRNELGALKEQHPDLVRYYGDFDPIVETVYYLNPCQCGNEVLLRHAIPDRKQVPGANNRGTTNVYRPRKAWFVECPGCGQRSVVSKKNWQAALIWNRSPQCIAPHYTEFPVFGLLGLPANEAKQRLTAIRKDLELRAKEAGLRRTLGYTRSNQKNLDRLNAFLQWCIYAQGAVKASKKINRKRGKSE